MIAGIGWLLFTASLLGAVYTIGSGLAVRWLFSRKTPPPIPNHTPLSSAPTPSTPAVTILKPLCGDEPGLAERVAQVCAQDYPGPVQIIFGVRDAADPAVPVIRRLMADHPDADIELVIDERVYGSNLKISNLMNMERRVRYDTLVVADSDVSVTPDYLSALMATLAQPGVGYATCAYFGAPIGNIWSRVSAMAIDYHWIPSVAFGLWLKMAEPCFGPTMAFRKDVFERAGGFAAFADRLADDFEIGHAIRALGYGFAISPIPIGHACPETDMASVLSHELRWARTIRLIDPAGYGGTVICHPLLFALAAAIVMQGALPGLLAVALALAARLFVIVQVDRISKPQHADWWLVPVRDLLSIGVFVASFMGSNVMWRGRKLRIGANGALVGRRVWRAPLLRRFGGWGGAPHRTN